MSKRQKMHKILDLVLDIDGITSKNREKGGPNVFMYFSGHIHEVTVQVFEDGWVAGTDPDYVNEIGLSYSQADTKIEETISYLRDFLKKVADREIESEVKWNY